jgi:hypothetical protein
MERCDARDAAHLMQRPGLQFPLPALSPGAAGAGGWYHSLAGGVGRWREDQPRPRGRDRRKESALKREDAAVGKGPARTAVPTTKGAVMQDQGSFGLLFDLSFTEFVTTRVVKILFVIGVICAAISALSFIVAGFGASFIRGLLFLLLSPAVFLIGVVLVRIWCEMVIVIFRIAENTGRLLEQKKSPLGPNLDS